MTVAFKNLPFDEAISYLKDKVDLPSEYWTDLWQGMHSRAFVVAGATKNELLVGIHSALNDAIANGTTLNDFKKNFRQIVADHGWTGSEKSPITNDAEAGYRAATIFNTNMRPAYSAGQYKQQTEPAVLKARPYLRYIGGLSRRPRPLHLQWNGLVLPADHPWWHSHYPPNGSGCKCKAVSMSKRELARDGLSLSNPPDDGDRDWTNPNTGEVVKVPNGIDPGWAYNPGQADIGKRLADEVMAAWNKLGPKAWKPLTPGDWETKDRPGKIPLDETDTRINTGIPQTSEGMKRALVDVMGAESRLYTFEGDNGFRYDINVDADSLARHFKPDRAPFLPFINEALTDPYEVWMSFEEHQGTGQVRLRQRIIKAVDLGRGKGLLMVTNAVNGNMEAWTFMPVSDLKYLNDQRYGDLVWKR